MDVFLDDSGQYYIPPHDAAALLSKIYKRPISSRSISQLARRKKHPIRTYPFGSWQMYNLEDIMDYNIKEKQNKRDTTNEM